MNLIPGGGIKISYATESSPKKKKKPQTLNYQDIFLSCSKFNKYLLSNYNLLQQHTSTAGAKNYRTVTVVP